MKPRCSAESFLSRIHSRPWKATRDQSEDRKEGACKATVILRCSVNAHVSARFFLFCSMMGAQARGELSRATHGFSETHPVASSVSTSAGQQYATLLNPLFALFPFGSFQTPLSVLDLV